uniref:THAP domain-containing protein 1 n=1 Tax=Oreochromis niloticus TaxID=8128 RepID=A0A669C651_ORENI
MEQNMGKYSEHCCVPLCSASAKFNGMLSFHGFPTHSDLRRQWLVNIRRDHFTITSHTRVCSRHFASDQLIEPTTLDGRRRLIKGAVPTLFEWIGFKVEPPRRSVWERTERRPELVPPDDQEEHSLTRDHDYCSVPEPSALDIICISCRRPVQRRGDSEEGNTGVTSALSQHGQIFLPQHWSLNASGLHVKKCKLTSLRNSKISQTPR